MTQIRFKTPARFLTKGKEKITISDNLKYKDFKGFKQPAHKIVISVNGQDYVFFPGEAIIIPELETKPKPKKDQKDQKDQND